VKDVGLFNFFCSETQVYHVNSASTSKHTNQKAQLQVSEYLFYLKTFSRIKYKIAGIIIWINFRFDLFLNRQNKDIPSIQNIYKQYKIFKKYYFKDVKKYRKKQNDYLRYENQN
jgi:hypothetical protein